MSGLSWVEQRSLIDSRFDQTTWPLATIFVCHILSTFQHSRSDRPPPSPLTIFFYHRAVANEGSDTSPSKRNAEQAKDEWMQCREVKSIVGGMWAERSNIGFL